MAKDIYNMDESGFTTVQAPGKVVSTLGKKQVGATTSQERGELTTLACTINAAGNALPPFYIFKRVRWNPSFLTGTPAGSEGAANKTAWMTTEVFSTQYLPFFITNTRCSPDRPVLLILDNHVSHVSLETIVLAKNSGVILLTLPPHTSHRLQPLDRTVFGPMKTFFNRALDDHMRSYPNVSITIYDTGALSARAFTKAMTLENIISGFRCTGIYPLNRDIFSEADYAPSTVTDRDLPSATLPEQQATSTNSVAAQPIASTSAISTQPLAAGVITPTRTPTSAVTPESRAGTSAVTPQDILPLPKAAPRKEGVRRRTRVKSAILTDPTEMTRIEREHQDRIRKKTKKRRVATPDSSSSEEEDNMAVPIIESDTDSVAESDVNNVGPEVDIGQFVLVRIDVQNVQNVPMKSFAYVGMIVAKSEEEYKIDFYKRTHQGTYVKPLNEEISFVGSAQILQILKAPTSSGTTARTLGSLNFGKIVCTDYELR